MAITSGTISVLSQNSEKIQLLGQPAYDGVGPYEYQWHKSTTSGFTPSSGTAIAGAESLQLTDSGNIPNTTVYYKLVSIDTGASNVEAVSAQLAVVIPNAAPAINALEQKPLAGMVDLPVSTNTVSAQVAASETGSIYNGEPVKLVPDTYGVPKVAKLSSGSDVPFGIVNLSVKKNVYKAGDALEISRDTNYIYVTAAGAITRGVNVAYDFTAKAFKAASGGDVVVGKAFDGAAKASDLFRLEVGIG